MAYIGCCQKATLMDKLEKMARLEKADKFSKHDTWTVQFVCQPGKSFVEAAAEALMNIKAEE